ncbi:hypothetical protein BC629DRAFT_599966 [Irpex lacteus]|nr:hypothetical protein BC629DRAFT_599966 [Irpex lacteus]
MSHRRTQSQDPPAYSSRTAEWVERHAHVRNDPNDPDEGRTHRQRRERSPIPSSSTSGPSSARLTRSTTLSRASGNSVRNEMAAYEARKQRTVVAPPATTQSDATHTAHSQSQSHRAGYKAGELLSKLTLDKYKAAPVLVQSPVEEGWPKSMSGRPPVTVQSGEDVEATRGVLAQAKTVGRQPGRATVAVQGTVEKSRFEAFATSSWVAWCGSTVDVVSRWYRLVRMVLYICSRL